VKHKIYRFPNDIGKNLPGSPRVEAALKTMWEMTPNKFLLSCITGLTSENVNNNYVYDANDGVFRRALFNFENYNDLTIDLLNFGRTCMFKTFNYDNGQPLDTPVFYIDNASEKIIAEETWKCSYLYKYNFVAYDGNSIVECLFENGDVEEATLIIKKIMEPKEIYIHFLLSYYKNWHEDLLRSVIEMIDYTRV
jgi:hypothetical protein